MWSTDWCPVLNFLFLVWEEHSRELKSKHFTSYQQSGIATAPKHGIVIPIIPLKFILQMYQPLMDCTFYKSFHCCNDTPSLAFPIQLAWAHWTARPVLVPTLQLLTPSRALWNYYFFTLPPWMHWVFQILGLSGAWAVVSILAEFTQGLLFPTVILLSSLFFILLMCIVNCMPLKAVIVLPSPSGRRILSLPPHLWPFYSQELTAYLNRCEKGCMAPHQSSD